MKVISVFGSSRPQPGDSDFDLAYQLGHELAIAGYAVANGAYSGTMTAVSQGAAEAGGKVIGVTCDEIEAWRPGGPNRWVTEQVRYPTMWERLVHLVVRNEGVIALPGGVGTLTEIALTWNQLQIEVLPPRPFILLGSFWREALAGLLSSSHVPARHGSLLQFADSPAEAVERLRGPHA